ncbi:hypothetical protein IJ732_03175 [bacterium]|nr:hypothetical protein [bacterium]
MEKHSITDRQFVSRLIYTVLCDNLPVREAILNFPKNTKDKSLKVAYHALIHREADDNLRAQDIEYREEQDDYLEFLAETLQKGESVPKNIIKEYEAWYPETTLPYSDSIKDLLKKLCKFLNV